MLLRFPDMTAHQPGCWGNVSVPGITRTVGMAVVTGIHENPGQGVGDLRGLQEILLGVDTPQILFRPEELHDQKGRQEDPGK